VKNKNQIKVYAATLNGTDIKKIKPLSEGVLIIGNESKGITNSLLSLVDEKITIIRRGKAESLNAAVATGIILSHLLY
jgi:TrmH family RNA methyltransferase